MGKKVTIFIVLTMPLWLIAAVYDIEIKPKTIIAKQQQSLHYTLPHYTIIENGIEIQGLRNSKVPYFTSLPLIGVNVLEPRGEFLDSVTLIVHNADYFRVASSLAPVPQYVPLFMGSATSREVILADLILFQPTQNVVELCDERGEKKTAINTLAVKR